MDGDTSGQGGPWGWVTYEYSRADLGVLSLGFSWDDGVLSTGL